MTRLSSVAFAILTVLSSASIVAAPAPQLLYHVAHGWPDLPEGRVLGAAAGVAVNSKQEVLVLHRADRVSSEPFSLAPIALPTVAVFDSRTGHFLREWGADRFAMPHGISVDDHDNVWITDVALQQIYKFSPGGRLLMVLGERGVAGADDRHFARPTQVAVLPDGSFYVADGYLNTRIVKFSSDGKFLFQWGRPGSGPGEFNVPHAIAVDKAGRVYVADRGNDRVQIFSGDGRFIRQIHSREIGRPFGLALLAQGRIVVADGGEQPHAGPDRSGLTILTPDGQVLQHLGRYGNYDGQFRLAHAVAVDAQNNLFVVDITGQRVQKFTSSRR